MKALVFEAPGRPVVKDVPMPQMKDTEVMIRTRAVGICHSDYELLGGVPCHAWP
jgi:L-iditol 2-dehydrogenase